MRFPRVWRGRWRLTVTALVTTAVGLGVAGQVSAASHPPAPTFSAVDLADAVLFDVGPASTYLARFQRPTNQWTDSARRHREAITEAIRADPAWSRSFARRLQSGDLPVVERALLELAILARAQADRLFGPAAVDRAVEVAHRGDGLFALTPPVHEHALDVVLQTFDVVVVAYILISSLTTEPGPQGQLLRDQLVHEIATKLDSAG
jgi:hypothetical protein